MEGPGFSLGQEIHRYIEGGILGSKVGCLGEVLLPCHPGNLVVFCAIDIPIP